MKTRDRFQFIYRVLRAVNKTEKITHFAMKANLDTRACRRYLGLMEKYNLIQKNTKFYELTENGAILIQLLSVCEDGNR